jgi:hypothetical protein
MDSMRRSIGKRSIAILAAAVSAGTIGHLRGQDKRVPELHPKNSDPITLTIKNQPPSVIYTSIALIAGINVVFDPEAKQLLNTVHVSLRLSNATLREALDNVATVTKTFWIPISGTTIAVARQE